MPFKISESEWVPVTPTKKTDEKKSSALKAIEAPKPVEAKPHASGEVIT